MVNVSLSCMDSADAAGKLLESEYGSHSLVIYRDLNTLRDFCSYYIEKTLREPDTVVQVIPFYETEDSVKNSITQRIDHKTRRADLDYNERRLSIVDSTKIQPFFLADTSNSLENLRQFEKVKRFGVRRLSLLEDNGAFFFLHRIKELIEYEASLDALHDVDLKKICLYHHRDFKLLQEDFKRHLINHHHLAIELECKNPLE